MSLCVWGTYTGHSHACQAELVIVQTTLATVTVPPVPAVKLERLRSLNLGNGEQAIDNPVCYGRQPQDYTHDF